MRVQGVELPPTSCKGIIKRYEVINMAKFSNGLFVITNIEYDIDDYADVEGVGLCEITYDEVPHVTINGVDYSLDEFMRI